MKLVQLAEHPCVRDALVAVDGDGGITAVPHPLPGLGPEWWPSWSARRPGWLIPAGGDVWWPSHRLLR